MKTINKTVAQWGLFTESEALKQYAAKKSISVNVALATIADALNDAFAVLAGSISWKSVEYADVEYILEPFEKVGTDDSKAYTCAAQLLVELYGLNGEDAKVAYCQFRYPKLNDEDQAIVEKMRQIVADGA